MGFKHHAKTYVLTFDDPELEGLEVKARSLSFAEVDDDDTPVIELFARALISWNLEDEDGKPLVTTLETLQNYPDVDFVTTLAKTWIEAVTGVDDELGKDSPSGKQSLEQSLPMEPLSLSLAN